MATSTVKIDVQVNSKSINDLEKELADINEQLNDVEIGSQAFKDLSKSAQAATAQLEKVNSEVEGFTADKKFMAADGAIKGFAGSISGVVGAFGLLGVESEKLGAFEEKAASAIALSMGLKDMAEGYKMIANAEVLSAPQLPDSLLAVFKLFTSVQLLPFHDSVFAVFVVGPSIPP